MKMTIQEMENFSVLFGQIITDNEIKKPSFKFNSFLVKNKKEFEKKTSEFYETTKTIPDKLQKEIDEYNQQSSIDRLEPNKPVSMAKKSKNLVAYEKDIENNYKKVQHKTKVVSLSEKEFEKFCDDYCISPKQQYFLEDAFLQEKTKKE